MWRITAETEMSPVAVDQVLALFPGVMRAWRELRFENGICRDDDGRLRRGLRVVEGAHPRPGARYLVAIEGTTPPELTAAQRDELRKLTPATRGSREDRRVMLDIRSLRQREMLESNARQTVIKRYEVEIREDSAERLVVVITEEPSGSIAEVSLDTPDTPTRLSVRVRGRATGRWPQKGKWTAEAELHLDGLPPHDAVAPQFRGRFRHRHFRGNGHVGVRARSEWLVYVECRVGGRGLMRPAAALASVVFGRRVRDDLRRRLEEAPDFTGDLQRQLDELPVRDAADAGNGPRAGDPGAAVIRMLLDRVVEDPDAHPAAS